MNDWLRKLARLPSSVSGVIAAVSFFGLLVSSQLGDLVDDHWTEKIGPRNVAEGLQI